MKVTVNLSVSRLPHSWVSRYYLSIALFAALAVSPGLMSRPSLSGEDPPSAHDRARAGVAGADVPAFVER